MKENNFINIINNIEDAEGSPLAYKLRPHTIDEVVGQEEILSKGKLLYKMIKNDSISSIILYGPPGSGKTTIARVIADTTSSNFIKINATTSAKSDMQKAVDEAKKIKRETSKRTIFFIDEIHRFNKAQQDFLLSFVEDGTITLIGATTENPYFEVNSALISRSNIFELKPLSKDNILTIIDRAITDKEKGLGLLNIILDDDAREYLADNSNGDCRAPLNALEIAAKTTDKDKDGHIHLDINIIKDCFREHGYKYDKNGDMHYDTISAFIKSMRGSDPDAAVYYLARMLKAGEDIKFIARRMVILASEDIGLADPMALVLATSCFEAVERVGLPESNLILSETCIYLAKAKKSNACCVAIANAEAEVENSGNLPIPSYLQDAHYNGAKKLGRGIGYKYPHDYPGHKVSQQYLPDEIKNAKFYEES